MVFGSITSIQIGSAVATSLFDRIGPAGAMFLRAVFATAMLWVIWRPPRRIPREQFWLVMLFGLSLAAVGLSFFAAIDRIPLGTAVTLEFSGPLAVALITSRRRLDLVWAGMAAAGIVLLTGGIDGGSLDSLGILLALVAGFFWGAYILIGTRLGVDSSGGSLLTLAMVVATLLMTGPGIASGGAGLVEPGVLAVGAVVGLLNAAVPFSLEFEAMRRLPSSVFGVMMSLEPAVAAAIGFLILGQGIGTLQVLAILLVVSASIGVLRSGDVTPVEP